MKIIKKKLSELNPSAYNPRKITKEEFAGLKESFLKFGMVEPLVWNKRTGNLVGGHQRKKLLEMEGVTETEVSVVDLSLSEEKALNIALNSPTTAGKFDYDILTEMLEEIKVDLPELFDGLGLDVMMDIGNTKDIEDEELPEEKTKFRLSLELKDLNEMMMFYDEMKSRKIKCKII